MGAVELGEPAVELCLVVHAMEPTLRGGTYDVYAFIPACSAYLPPSTNTARYIVQHAQGAAYVPMNQAAAAGTWALIGRFQFAPGKAGYIQLRNVGDAENTAIWFDAVKWVPVTQ